jgi:hypothetical protein
VRTGAIGEPSWNLNATFNYIELDAWQQNSKFRLKASLHKGGGLRLPPIKGAGHSEARPLCGNPVWRLAFGLSLEFCSQAIKCLDLDSYWALQCQQLHCHNARGEPRGRRRQPYVAALTPTKSKFQPRLDN